MKTIITSLLVICTINAHAQTSDVTTGQYQRKISQSLNVAGTTTSGTVYIIDGLQTREIPTIKSEVAKPFNTPGHYTLTREEINQAPTTNVRDLPSLFPGVYQSQRGADINVYGSR